MMPRKMCKDKVHIRHLAVFSLKTRDTLLEDECVSEEEEGFIQSFICDKVEEGTLLGCSWMLD